MLKKLGLLLALFSLPQCLNLQPVKAQQIIPAADGTMTVVTPNGDRFTITGGTLSGDGRNLFHTFQEFGLSAEQIATFLSNPSIQNILSRVTGGNPSVINGAIEVVGGNSNLYLMNPAGIIFGSGASLNVPADFTATTATGIGFDGGWFKAFGTNDYANLVGNPNGFQFQSGQTGVIINAGDLAVKKGQNLALLSNTVVNTGTLKAPGGNVTIAAVPGTNRVRLAQEGSLLSLEIEPQTTETGETLPVRGLDLPTLLTGSGVETGLEVTSRNEVKLSAGTTIPTNPGTAIISGIVDTSNAASFGGTINLLGDRVGVIDAQINASGQTGGGTVLIGGDYKGQGTVPNGQTSVVDKNSIIDANALSDGDGGRVIVWADKTTAFSGRISARGGENSGNGGFVEVSGKDNLSFQGNVDVSALNGNPGTLLLDPANITIVDGEGVNDPELTDSQILAGNSPEANLTISETALENAAGNVVLEANNNITINDLSDNELSLSATSIRFTADADNLLGGAFSMHTGDILSTQAGDLNISGASITSGLINTTITTLGGTTGGNVTIRATNGGINLGGTDSNENSITAKSITIDTPGALTATGSLNARNDGSTDSGNITIGNTLTPSSISVGAISTRNLGEGNGGNIDIRTTGALNVVDAFDRANGLPVATINPNADISIGSEANGKGGEITINAGSLTTAAGIVSNSRTSGNGGNIAVTSTGNIQTGFIDSSAENGNAGAINLTSNTGGVATNGVVDASTNAGNGGAVNYSAANNITTGTMLTSSETANGGNITLNSTSGAIDTTVGPALSAEQIANNLGNNVEISKITEIKGLISASRANGGKIQLTAAGNIFTANLFSSSLLQGQGGAITLNSSNGAIDTSAAQNFSASFPDPIAERQFAGIDSGARVGTGAGTLNVTGTNLTIADNIFTDGNILIKSPVTVRDNTTIDAGVGGITAEQPISAIGSASIAIRADKDIVTNSITTGIFDPNSNGTPPPQGATLIIDTSPDGPQLAGFIVGPGINITNVRFTGVTGASGTFRGGRNAGLGIDRGIILTSGDANLAPGPNNSDSAERSNNTAGDPDLNNLVPGSQTNDATAIEIEFTTGGGKVFINYVFASEEYNEFVGSEFNDVFGFFVDGTNIAVVPGTNQPVSVNTINAGNPNNGTIASNPNLYNNNSPGDGSSPFNTQYDGFTRVLTATSPELSPGAHTIKLAIADTADSSYDSAVLVESGSLAGEPVTPGNIPSGNIAIESREGAVSVGNITTASNSTATSGNIDINAATTLNTGTLDTSSAQGNGGNVTLDAGDNILVDRIDAQGGTSGLGGDVNITSDRFFQATGTFSDRNDRTASISTAGGTEGGDITITHGGRGETPFVVGATTQNGTAGAVTSGTDRINSGSFLFNEIQGNVSILSGIVNPNSNGDGGGSNGGGGNGGGETPSNAREVLLQETENNSDPGQFQSTPPTQLAATAPPPIIPIATIDQAQKILTEIEQEAAVKPALIYVSFNPARIGFKQDFAQQEARLTGEFEEHLTLPQDKAQPTLSVPPSNTDELELLAITAKGEPIRVRIPEATRAKVLQTAEQFYDQVANLGDNYLAPSQQMYQWLLAPIEAELKARGIQNYLFIMPDGLRLVPLAALHDGKQFVSQKYSTGFAPSLNLIDYRYRNLKKAPVLAFGASEFEAEQNQTNLPAVEIEVPLIANQIRKGKFTLDRDFTLQNLVTNREDNPYPIIHLATHADFQPGDLSKSYIQLYNQKIGLNELRELGLNNPTVDLLVISACRSAYGDRDAELGFAGLAVQAGVKTAIASLWYVGDTGTLALMSEFYRQLESAPIKAEALRAAQVAMIEGKLRKQGNEIVGTRGNVPLPEGDTVAEEDLTHPFYWSAFTMIGSPW